MANPIMIPVHGKEMDINDLLSRVIATDYIDVAWFVIDRYYGEIDLAYYAINLTYKDPCGNGAPLLLDTIARDERTFTLEWKIGPPFTSTAGKTEIQLWTAESDDDGKLIMKWQTYPKTISIRKATSPNLNVTVNKNILDDVLMKCQNSLPYVEAEGDQLAVRIGPNGPVTYTDHLTGPKGANGEDGADGEKGDQGDRGEKGDKGDKGDRGEVGKNAYQSALDGGYPPEIPEAQFNRDLASISGLADLLATI